ncbi:hypothetical protein TruAng_010388 [Truncatella angustata]|nr:hypothetical protein TruAng_010388 [Truncatella angustata]
MDSRNSSVDETRPLNPDGEQHHLGQESPRPLSPSVVQPPLTPPAYEYLADGGRREIGIRLTSILRLLTISLTLANIILQISSAPRGGLWVFLVVWDFFIITWYPLALLVEVMSTLPPITIFVGNWTFQYSGPRRDSECGDAVHDITPKRKRGATDILRNLTDVILAVVLFSCSTASITELSGHRLSWYNGYSRIFSNGTPIAILHFFVFAFMLTMLMVRLLQTRTGASVLLKLALTRDNELYKYRIQLPSDEPSQKSKNSVPIYA